MPENSPPLDAHTQLTQFNLAETTIATLGEKYLSLTIDGLDDIEGYAAVHRARMDIRDHRVAIEKTRKQLKADALEYGRQIDKEARRLTLLIEPIEAHLQREEWAINDEKKRIKEEARQRLEAEAQAKADAEAAEAKRVADTEAARLKADQDAENERLRVEREKLDAERKALEAEKARMAAQQKAVQDKLDAQRLAVEKQNAKAEAAEKARVETEVRLAREAVEKAAREKAEAEAAEAARLRAEALRPDRTKLLGVADVIDAITLPKVSTDAKQARTKVSRVLTVSSQSIRTIVDKMI